MSFIEQINKQRIKNNSMVCVGLDPFVEKMPIEFQNSKTGIFDFNKAIIDATYDVVCSYKPQFAHYAAIGQLDALKQTIAYIKKTYPEVPVILDSKRGDIGTTADMYAKEAFEQYNADAVTVNPYMGDDTILPFTAYKDKGVVILCRTSNPGAGVIQNIKSDGKTLFEIIAERASTVWNENNNVMLVVGATAPEEMARIRSLVGNMEFLVPGLGAQGGDVQAVMDAGLNADNSGLVINSSRGVLYASNQLSDFAQKARLEAIALRDQANQYKK
ncbi:orotidine-5'-phosphate decarboxylase [Marinicellulosiphila megalodicopiae]|uniref:orotidine-5'-phosphate decarboxylase n=1 Tax=Marinicellulosiphila megalodicopiae TaxID=2724896 RepID=UPI003BB0E22C